MSRRRAIRLVYQGLLGVLFAALLLTSPAQAQSEEAAAGSEPAKLAVAAAPRPVTAGPPLADRPTSGVVAELLGLIKQIEPLRVTMPYVDYHDQARDAQAKHQLMRRRAGIGRTHPGRINYDASEGWSSRESSGGGRSGFGRSSERPSR